VVILLSGISGSWGYQRGEEYVSLVIARGRVASSGPNNCDHTEADVSIVKSTRIREGMDLQFRAECFHLANHPNFQTPSTNYRRIFDGTAQGNLVSNTVGTLTAPTTTSSRQIQFGLKLVF
jgi:hypothetical protein